MSVHTDAERESKRGSFGYTDFQLYKFMFHYIAPYKIDMLLILAVMILSSIATVLGPILIMIAINLFTGQSSNSVFGVKSLDILFTNLVNYFSSTFQNIQIIWLQVSILSFTYLLLQLIIFGLTYIQTMKVTELGLKAELTIRLELFEHLQELDLSYHDKNEVGRIMSRLTSDLEAIRQMLGGQVINNIANILTLLVVLVVVINMDLVLSMVSILLIPIVIYLGGLSKKFSRPRRKETRRTNSILMANIGEAIAGIKVTKGMNREHENINIFRKLNTDNYKANIDADDMNAIFFPLMLSLSTLATACLILVGGLRVIAGIITIGELTAFLNYNAIMFRPVVLLGQFYQQLQDALTGSERVYALLNTKTKVKWNNQLPEIPPIDGEVTFDRIKFEYIPGKPVYEKFSLYVPPGSTIALVGKTGAGKTTIINILSRLYEYQEGHLLIDNHDILEYSLPSIRKQIASVPQDFFLFSTSIKENLKLGNPLATEDEMWDALERVGLRKYVEEMPEKLDTPLQERGGRLSVGQRQLLVFAAVLIANPRIVILDEATSSIDMFSELLIQKAIKEVLKGRTAFIIAHRLSTIRNADTIVVIESGHIVEQGTHDELVGLKGAYYRLVKNQIELSQIQK